MSNVPISGLPAAGTLNGTFLFPVVDIGTPNVTQQATLNGLAALYLSLATGGTITGPLELNGGSLTISNTVLGIVYNSPSAVSIPLEFSNVGVTTWSHEITSAGYFIARWTSDGSTEVDSPIQISWSTGLVTMIDGAALGSSGTAGKLTVYPATASKGTATITASDNSGNTVTNLNFAAQAGARTFTVPDPGGNATILMTTATMNTSGLSESNVAMMSMRNPDGSVLTTSGSSTTFAVSSTVGTSLGLAGANAKSATITSDAIIEFTLPPTYISTHNFNVVVNAQIAGTGTPGTKTLAVKAYAMANDGTAGANIGPATQNMTTSAADYTFAITGTSLTPGEKVLLEIESVLQETGGSNNINTQINSVRVK